ncbi:facilitated trehalose transporter Tret1 [Folsomia candida]|uniref:Facilitated trehalose transporter Tret1 n=1 Tax=Folsomia candida TaxID=158441 RepID=A0A226DAN2_FOLCA|nr:facilitated trehalose transporter Tret1 [Folsomia candida]OXA41671.1 Facilitated trehalose transporter Tret1 [Folsomia candida]
MVKVEHIPLIDREDNLHRRNQMLTVAGATLALFATGNIMGFSSVTIPSLLSTTSEIKTTAEDMSWMASMVTLGCILGTVIGGLTSDAIGRKKTILLSSIIYSLGWIVIGQAQEVADLLVGRMLTGIASGFYGVSVQVYICEIVEPDLRGVSGSLPSLMVSIGILCTWCLGAIMDWRSVALLLSLCPIFVFIYVIFLPESPVWLISKGRHSEALKSLGWLRDTADTAEQEFLRLQFLRERRVSSDFSMKNCCSRFFERSVQRPLFIGTFLFFVQQFSGQYAIIFYATMIFRYADHFINDYLETIVVGIVRMFATLIAIFLVNFLSRRFLLIMSGLIMCFANGILGAYFYIRESEGDFTNSTLAYPRIPVVNEFLEGINIEWVPLACLILFMIGYSIGLGIIPWFLIAEVLPSDVRSMGCSIAFGLNQFFLFVSVKTFITTVDVLNAHGTFWFYSVIAFIGVIFVIFVVPETANLNSGEIEDIFENRSHKNGKKKGRHGSFDESTF